MGTWLHQGFEVAGDQIFGLPNIAKSMNGMMREMHSLWSADSSSSAKPAFFPKGLTSHSNRASGMALCNRDRSIHKMWVDNRAGLAKSSIDTAYNYDLGDMETDRPCALRLSNWPNSSDGGICPNIDAIPTLERESFLKFSKDFFCLALSKVSEEVISMMAIVQVLWYGEFQHLHYFRGMTGYATHESLLSWSNHIKQELVSLNSFALPGNRTGNRLPENVRCLSTSINDFSADLSSMRTVITNLAVSSDRQERNLTTICEHIQLLAASQNMILSRLDAASGATPSSRIEAARPAQRTARAADDSQGPTVSLVQTVLPFASANPNASISAALVTIFKAPNSLSDLIIHWYCRRLYAINWGAPAIYDIRKCAKLIEYSKRFMDPGTTIPDNGEVDIAILTPIAARVQSKVSQFLNTPSVVEILKASATNQMSTIREVKSLKVWATYKRLEIIFKSETGRLLFPPLQNITDTTPVSPNVEAFSSSSV